MSREVQHNGAGAFHVRFPFDRKLVELVKTLPNRRWNAAERFWWVPEEDAVLLVELLLPARFVFDAATREAYQSRGGNENLEGSPPAPGTPLPMRGLFDELPATNDFSVSRLNQEVQQVIEGAFPEALWLVGEISGFNRNAHKRHVGFQLVEQDEDGKTIASVDASLFDTTRRLVERALHEAQDPFVLEDEVTVRVRARVELYVPWGSYRVVVEELDVHYTLGEAARRREEIIRRLTEQGLVGLNTALLFPAVPLRVGLITSLGSDAYNDILRTLQESGFAFRLLAHGARMQGRATEPSVLQALERLRLSAADLDVVLICRGGGSRTDLAWLDSEALGRAVARFPLPVVVGVGHEQDHSVLDAVGWRCKTPTAAAAHLVDAVRRSLERVDGLILRLLQQAGGRLAEERRRGGERARHLAAAARGLLRREASELDHRRGRTWRAARGRIERAVERLTRWSRDIPRASRVTLVRQQGVLDALQGALGTGARRGIVGARRRIDLAAGGIGPRARRVLARESERSESRGRRLFLIDPRRVVERGYAILRLGGGPVIQHAAMAPPGSSVEAELKDGRLSLRVEPNDGRGGH